MVSWRQAVLAVALSAGVSTMAAAEPNPCDERADLDKAAFHFVFEPDGPSKPVDLEFQFESCSPYYAEESPHGWLTVSEAIRRYKGAGTPYVLVVVTPVAVRGGSGASELVLVRDVHTISYGALRTDALRDPKPIDLGPACRLVDEAGDKEYEGKATLTPR